MNEINEKMGKNCLDVWHVFLCLTLNTRNELESALR